MHEVLFISVSIRWLGISAFVLKTEKGVRILIDPNLSNNPWSPLSVDDVDRADLILVSHGAEDHGIDDAIEISKRNEAYLQVDSGLKQYAIKKGFPAERFRSGVVGEVEETSGVRVRNVAANHTTGIFPGQTLGFIIGTESGIGIYHTGDTAIFPYLKLVGELYHPDIMMINVSRKRSPTYPGMSVPMSPFEGVLAVQWVGCRVVIPMHYDPDSGDGEYFAELVDQTAPWCKPIVLGPGETYEHVLG